MPQSVICLPKGVVRTPPEGKLRTRFTSLATQKRLENEDAYRKERSDILSARQINRRQTQDSHEAAREAENRLQLFGLIFAQLARQDNELQNQQATGNDKTSKERERARLEATEVLRTTL